MHVLPFIRLGHPAILCTKLSHPTIVATRTKNQGHGIEKHLEFTILFIFQFWLLWEVKGQQSISGATPQPQEIMSFVQGLVALKVKEILPGMKQVVVWTNINIADTLNLGCILEKDVDYRGHNILGGLGYKAGVTSAQACAELSLSKGVPFWTYQYSYQRCFVKSSDSKATILKGVISGTQACAFPQLAPLGVVASQRLNDSPPQLCADSNSTTFCVVEKARFPWIALYLGLKVRISRVEIRNRADCCGDKFRNIEVRVTDTLPNTGIFHTS